MFAGPKNSRKALTTAAAAVAGVLGGAAASYGALTMEVRATAVSGTGVTLVNNNSVTVTPASVGGVISFSVYAHVTGGNNLTDGFQTTTFQLISQNTNGGSVLGNLANTGSANAISNGLLSPFNAAGATLGSTALDLDTDTDTDIGGTNINTSTNMAAVRSAVMTVGNDFEVYRFSLPIATVLANPTGVTSIMLNRRTTPSSTAWQEAGVAKSPTTGTFGVTPTAITLVANNSQVSLTAAALNTNVADNTNSDENPGSPVAGAVHVTGSGSGYQSEIDGLTTNSNKASAVVDSAINAPVYAMLWLVDQGTNPTSTIAGLLADLQTYSNNNGNPYTVLTNGAVYSSLNASYGAAAGTPITALIQFNGSLPANGAFNWDFSSQNDIVLDRVALVPEPTAAAAFLLPVAGLVGSRRRRRR